jgi:KUP system potassium uptake protein
MSNSTQDTTGPDKRILALAVGAIGVVFGDIGTSPLYTMREAFTGPHPMTPTLPHVLGVL